MADLLALEDLVAGYGEARVLAGVSLTLAEASAVAVLGRNGMGKTTLVNTIVGLTDRVSGRIILAGREVTGLRPDQRAAAGIGWVPQERNIFASLTVEENLTVIARPGPWSPARIFGLFPRLAARRRHWGGQLSGGEQQMLAVGRALVLNPRLLLLDEPLEGLAPIVAEELVGTLRQIIRGQGVSAIVVEQNVRQALAMTDHAAILERGTIVYHGTSQALAADPERLSGYLGVSARPGLPRAHAPPRLTAG
jgi:branched-chain amino acid transport system ATP-binding protein